EKDRGKKLEEDVKDGRVRLGRWIDGRGIRVARLQSRDLRDHLQTLQQERQGDADRQAEPEFAPERREKKSDGGGRGRRRGPDGKQNARQGQRKEKSGHIRCGFQSRERQKCEDPGDAGEYQQSDNNQGKGVSQL